MTVPKEVKYFEDYAVGVVKEAGSLSLNQDGVMVMSMKAFNLVTCRNTSS